MYQILGWLRALFARPAWRRAAILSEEILVDLVTTLVYMAGLFIAHKFTKFLGVDQYPIAQGFTLGQIFIYLHVLNLLINGAFALWHLIRAHTSHHDP